MIARLAVVAVVAATGCAISGGTATVGIWRPQRVVDTVVCIEAQPGRCAKTVEVGREVPARSFAGGMFAWFNPGYTHITGSTGPHRFALHSHYDYLRGRGAFALGGRVGANVSLGLKHMLFTVPVSVLGYWGYPWASLYGGVGYTPYASESATMDDDTETRRRLHGFHVLGGARVVLKTGRWYRMSLTVEGTHQDLGSVTATSTTMNIGLHF